MAKQISLPKPYSVPSNWCWTNMGEIVSMKTGFPFDSNRFSRESDEKRPLIRIRDVLKGETETFTDEPCPDQYVVHAGEILIGMDGDFNVAKWKSEDALLNQRVCAIQTSSKLLLNDYLYYYLPDILKKINDATPSVTVKHLSTKTLDKTPIPVAPLTEQQRIVERIESLFAKLDEAKEKAQAVVDGFETRKAAILHKAFTGDLTAKWREENQVGKDSWVSKKLSEVSSLQTGLMKGKKYSEKTVMMPYLRVANVQDGYLDLSEIKEIEVAASQMDRYKLKKSDVLFTEGGDFDKLGRGTVWTGEIEDCLHQNHIFVVRPNTDILNPYFLSYQAGSRYGKRYFLSCSKQTTNLASINSTQLKNFPVIIPSIEEQEKIVSVVDKLLAKEQQAKEAAEAVLDRIETMKKAILARAFRGELGTNDPTEESAVELLKQVLRT